MKLVYTNENQLMVGHLKNLLENQGITTIVKNEFLGSGFGELSGADTWPELWVVEDDDYSRAAKLAEEMIFEPTGKEWRCPSCHEVNGAAFEQCWKCQSNRSL